MIARVLDEVLEWQPGFGDQAALLDGVTGFLDLDGMERIPMESEDFLKWLDNADWNNSASVGGW
jgi:hypothetical protein